MPIGHWNVEWGNLNSQRRYPLADDASGVDQSGSFTLPSDFLIYLDLPIHAGLDVDPARFFIKHVGAYATGYSVIVGYQPTEELEPVNVATALIARQTHVKGMAYALGGIGDYFDTMGKLVVGRLENIDQQPPGFWTFDFENGRLDVDAVRPIIRGVSGMIVVNGNQRSDLMQGDIEIAAGANTQLVPIIAEGQDPIIVINFLSGEGTVEDCVCEGDTAQTPPIKTFNGVGASPDGEFNLIGSPCIEVEAIEHGVRLINKCAEPCCSCPELEKITADLERLLAEQRNVVGFQQRVGNAVDTMNLTVLGARLNDAGCVTCE